MLPSSFLAAAGGLMPPRGAVVGIAALLALVVLDRAPLRADRPREDEGRTPRRRRRPHRPARVRLVRDDRAATTVHRLDQPAITARQPCHRNQLEGRSRRGRP